jgi:mannose-6-phosphate isomerase
MNELYPLKFRPILKDRIWGGDKLKTVYGKQGKCSSCGESWELSAVPGDISVVENGFLKNNNLSELIEVYMGDLVGDKVFEKFGLNFPLLIKLIDATDDLSIQVHPDDALALKRHNSFGKTEMWYVLDVNPGASLISGFNKQITKETYLQHLSDGKIKQILNRLPVEKGDVFFIPAGRVHAIGAGIMLAEIQQTSDITYRIYDWDRVDANGKSRELHTEEAIDAIDYKYYDDIKTIYNDKSKDLVNIAQCPYFTTNKIKLNKILERDYIEIDSFVIYMCCEGAFDLVYNKNERVEVAKGQTVLLPAIFKDVTLAPKAQAELLEVYIK